MGCLKKLLFGGMIAGAVAVLAVVLVYLLWYRPAVAEMPVFETDYLAQWQGAELEGGADSHAWPVMVRAVEEMGQLPGYDIEFRGRTMRREIERDLRPGDADWDLLEEFVNRPEVNTTLDRLRDVADKPVLGHSHSDGIDPAFNAALVAANTGFVISEPSLNPNPSMHALDLPYGGTAYWQSRLLMTRGFLRGIEGGAGVETVRDLEAALAVSRHVERQGGGIVTRIGVGLAGESADTALELLARDLDGVEQATLDQLDSAMEAWQGRKPINPFEFAVFQARDLMQRVYGTGGRMTAVGVARLSEHELGIAGDTSMLSRVDEGLGKQVLWVQAYSVFARGGFPDESELEALVEEFVPLGETFGNIGPWEMDPEQSPMKGIYRIAQAFEAYEALPLQLGYAHTLASKMTEAGCVAVSRVSAVRLVIAAIRHRQETGDWSSSADELGDGSAWPDGFTGEPLKVIASEAGPVIYSAGTDRNDDGGRECEEPDQFWWPKNAAKMEKSRPEQFDGDWVLWTTSLHEDRAAKREAAREADG